MAAAGKPIRNRVRKVQPGTAAARRGRYDEAFRLYDESPRRSRKDRSARRGARTTARVAECLIAEWCRDRGTRGSRRGARASPRARRGRRPGSVAARVRGAALLHIGELAEGARSARPEPGCGPRPHRGLRCCTHATSAVRGRRAARPAARQAALEREPVDLDRLGVVSLPNRSGPHRKKDHVGELTEWLMRLRVVCPAPGTTRRYLPFLS